MDRDAATILNHAFVRVFRSFGQYVREACIQFDVGAETLRPLLDRQHCDAERLGTAIADRFGAVYTGFSAIELGDVNFLNCSRVLDDWIRWQQELVAGLETDRSDLARLYDSDLGLLDEILGHEREALQALTELRAAAHAEPCTAGS